MSLFHKKTPEEKRRHLVRILSLLCYVCAIGGVARTLTLLWEMGHNPGDSSLTGIIYTFIHIIIMVWISVLIALIARNAGKGIIFDKSNAQLITWVGAVVVAGGCVQYLLQDFTDMASSIPTATPTMLYYLLGMFILFIGQIFHIGIRMKEEQDLTI